jgi:hypothetical protein
LFLSDVTMQILKFTGVLIGHVEGLAIDFISVEVTSLLTN